MSPMATGYTILPVNVKNVLFTAEVNCCPSLQMSTKQPRTREVQTPGFADIYGIEWPLLRHGITYWHP